MHASHGILLRRRAPVGLARVPRHERRQRFRPQPSNAFNPATPPMISAMQASRASDADSPNSAMPSTAMPVAPMPVQTA